MQAFDAVFANFGWQWLTPIVGIMLVTASLGGMLTWLAGPSKGLLLISRQEGYLPPYLQKLNKNGVQQNILVVQGLLTTVIGLGLRADPRRLQRLLDLLGDHHAGVPDHVPADVRGRGPAAPQATPTTHAATGPRCSSACAASASPPRWPRCWSGSSRRRSSSDGNGGVYFLIVGGGALGLGLLVPVPVLQVPQALVEAARAVEEVTAS